MVDRFRLVLENVPYEVEHKGDLLLINGQEFPFNFAEEAVNVSGKSYTVEVRDNKAMVDGIAYPLKVVGLEKSKPNRRKATRATPSDDGAITAIMPGLIIKVLKREGERVDAGELVMILEAMKMQNELRAKKPGVIKRINVKEGETVEMRQVLAVIE